MFLHHLVEVHTLQSGLFLAFIEDLVEPILSQRLLAAVRQEVLSCSYLNIVADSQC